MGASLTWQPGVALRRVGGPRVPVPCGFWAASAHPIPGGESPCWAAIPGFAVALTRGLRYLARHREIGQRQGGA